MKWEGNRESDNVEDRRAGGGGGLGGLVGGRGIGIGTIVIALLGTSKTFLGEEEVWLFLKQPEQRNSVSCLP